jgi:hypothetical protein
MLVKVSGSPKFATREVRKMDFSLDFTDEQKRFAKEVGDWLDENIPKGLGTIRDAQ